MADRGAPRATPRPTPRPTPRGRRPGTSSARDDILGAARVLFAERGYAATSVREIAEAVGVTKPTLYYHFGSKDGLFTALVNHHLGCWLDAVSYTHLTLPTSDLV